MKRKNFKIEANGQDIGVKHTWNASLRFVESAIRQYAEHFEEEFTLHNSVSRKGPNGKDHIGGVRVWKSSNQLIHFTIQEII